MKKYFIIPLIVLFAFSCWAISPAMLGLLPQSSVDACSACPSDSDSGDMICEDFEGSGNICTWTEDIGGTNTGDDDNSHGGTYSCNDRGLVGIKFIYDFDQGNANFYKAGFSDTTVKAMMDFRIISHTLEDTEGVTMIAFSDGSDYSLEVIINYDTDHLELFTRYIDDGASWDSIAGTTEVVIGTWYTLTAEWVSTASILVKLDSIAGGSPSTEATDTSNIGAQTVTTVHIGVQDAWGRNVESGDTASFELDRIKIDDDTLPSQCGT